MCMCALTESVRKLGGELPELTLRSGPPVGEDQLGILQKLQHGKRERELRGSLSSRQTEFLPAPVLFRLGSPHHPHRARAARGIRLGVRERETGPGLWPTGSPRAHRGPCGGPSHSPLSRRPTPRSGVRPIRCWIWTRQSPRRLQRRRQLQRQLALTPQQGQQQLSQGDLLPRESWQQGCWHGVRSQALPPVCQYRLLQAHPLPEGLQPRSQPPSQRHWGQQEPLLEYPLLLRPQQHRL